MMTNTIEIAKGFEDIRIEKNVPLPVRNGNYGSKYAHLIRALEVGDSFWIAKDMVNKGFPANVRIISKSAGIKTTVRTSKEKPDRIGWRVWRVE
jgi:hypothetical protein